ncbi:MAG: hypothetical protein WB421_16965 [Terriglobales bacterium]
MLRNLNWLACLITLLCSSGLAQQAPASVTFKFDFPGADPDHYTISVSSDGHASYESNGKLTSESDPGDPFHLQFNISQPTRTRIFDLAEKSNYFRGKIDSGKKGLANTGTKVLIYRDSEKSTRATFNYSPVPAVQDLTALFQQLSTTLEFGRRLDYYRHYQKTALDDELKRMEQLSKENDLGDLSVIAPILQQIADDASLMHVVRTRAQRLLAVPVK